MANWATELYLVHIHTHTHTFIETDLWLFWMCLSVVNANITYLFLSLFWKYGSAQSLPCLSNIGKGKPGAKAQSGTRVHWVLFQQLRCKIFPYSWDCDLSALSLLPCTCSDLLVTDSWTARRCVAIYAQGNMWSSPISLCPSLSPQRARPGTKAHTAK